jgi:hypothetical protein
MIKYHVTALALKAFSSCEPTRNLYRNLGNRLGGNKRTGGNMPENYYERAVRNVTWCSKYAPLQPDDQLLELGTGWVHWEALTLRLFFDFKAVLYDVWDNRQLSALKSFVRQLGGRFGQDGFLEGCDFDRARYMIKKIDGASNFDDLYKLLGFRYVLDPTGLMESLPREAFRVTISAGVLEHIPAVTAGQFVSNINSLMTKNGLGIHGINIMDHLYLYDMSANPKQYLAYSERRWRLCYENGVQYINRIQRSEWVRMFDHAGFSLLEEASSYADMADLRIHPRYAGFSREDLSCTTVVLIVRKA